MYERILVPTDGSNVAAAAGDAAVKLARQFDADLHAIHVLEDGDVSLDVSDEDDEELIQYGRDTVRAIGERAAEDGVDVTSAVLDDGGSVHSVILDYTVEHEIDCIVMGTHGRSGISRFVLGSVAEQTLRESPVPVVTIHEDTVFDPEFESLLVPTDGSSCAYAALDHAIGLALATGAALHVVNVVDVKALTGNIDAGSILDALEEAGERAIDDAVKRADEAGVSTVEANLMSGTPYRAICEYADEREIDGIVMGTHGRSGIERFVLGSVTERVVRHSDVPTFAIKDRAKIE